MSEYPIEGLMNTAMNSIREMVDVNTIIGDPIQTSNNVVIIPVSKVNFGFAAGGSEFKGKTIDINKRESQNPGQLKRKTPIWWRFWSRSEHFSYCIYCSTSKWR